MDIYVNQRTIGSLGLVKEKLYGNGKLFFTMLFFLDQSQATNNAVIYTNTVMNKLKQLKSLQKDYICQLLLK